MIPVSAMSLDSAENNQWQKEMATSLRSSEQLLNFLRLTPQSLPYQLDMAAQFKTRVTRYFAGLINREDPFDPILLQVLPRLEETIKAPGFSEDPLQEQSFSPHPGLIQKYRHQLLVITHQACAAHCRYCFRRHFPYSNGTLTGTAQNHLVPYIEQDPMIEEVILSGGDPLSINDRALSQLITPLFGLKQLKAIRFHTRTPVLLPNRITPALAELLAGSPIPIVMVLHINHQNEISNALQAKMKALTAAGVTLLNQSVLLRQVNDTANTLAELSYALFAVGILPYYLHLLDPVAGTQHFFVTKKRAIDLWEKIQVRLPGYLMPRLVIEKPGQSHKIWVAPNIS